MFGHKSWVLIVIFLFFCGQVIDSQAQKIQKNFSISWTDPMVVRVDEDNTVSCMHFVDAVYGEEFESLPTFVYLFPVDRNYSDYEVVMDDIVYEAITDKDKLLIPNDFQAAVPHYKVKTKIAAHQPYAVFSLLPIVKNGVGYSRMVSFSVTLKGINPIEPE
ncbi:MAG: hypothetical protein MJZ76_01330, partial [Bacteroidales bacterium]|nr:hypothetical protein [Bacteroidales bacterium]